MMSRKHLLIMLVSFVMGMCVVVYVLQEKSDEVVHPYHQAIIERNQSLRIADLADALGKLEDASVRAMILDAMFSNLVLAQPLPEALRSYQSRLVRRESQYILKDLATLIVRDHPHLFIEELIGRLRELAKVTPLLDGMKENVWEDPNGDVMVAYFNTTILAMSGMLPDAMRRIEMKDKKILRMKHGRMFKYGFMSRGYSTSNTSFIVMPSVVYGLSESDGELQNTVEDSARVVDVSPENVNSILDALENYYKTKLKGKSE